MAIVIVSGNLNVWGNNGQYETDPSTWGFGSNSLRTIGRTVSTYQSAGLHALYGIVLGEPFGNYLAIAHANFPVVAGRKYLAKAKVRVNEPYPPAEDEVVVRIQTAVGINITNFVYTTTKTIAEIKDGYEENNWFDIETRFEASATGTVNDLFVALLKDPGNPDANELKYGGPFAGQLALFVDEFEVYEYEETVDPPTCTLEIDVPGTVVVNETSPSANDGSITVAVTGDVGTIEYQLNGGTWQTSNMFTGLDSGLHTIKVREQADTDCEDTEVFSVNSAGIAFDFTLSATHETVSGANDGIITATVTGTGGPFTFAIDGGAYQGSNTFEDLVPGLHYVTVKNAVGDTLTKSITVNAGVLLFEKIFFSKNPVTYLQQASSGWELLNNYRLYDDVRVEDVTGSSVYTSRLKVDQPPASDGSVLFSVRRAFRDALKAVPPSQNEATLKRLTDRLKYFKHFTGELQDDEVTPAALTGSDPFLVMLGGLSTLKHPSVNFFTSYVPTNKNFMSWAPLQKVVDLQQEDYLNFWIYNTTITSLKMRIKVYYDDGSDVTQTMLTVTGTVYGHLYQVPVGPTNSGVLGINPAKNILKYEVSMLDQANVVISEIREFIIAEIKHPLTRYFMFLDSLGTYSVHRFTGVASLTADYEGEAFEKYLAPDYTTDDIQIQNDSVTFQNKGSFSTGYIKGPDAAAWLSYFRDLLKTSRLYDVTSGSRVPMKINTRQMLYREDQNHERFVRFEAEEAYINESHTPEEI